MQITVKTTKKLTEGTNKYGAWVLYKIEAADGKIYTTLADGADKLTPGTVFEPAEVMLGEEKDGVQEFKFKKFTLVTSGEPASGSKPNGKPDMSKGDWAEKDRTQRQSIERQVSVKCACEIASNNETIEQILETAEKIAGWIAKK